MGTIQLFAVLSFLAVASAHFHIDKHIIGGDFTSIQRFPHQVSLEIWGKHSCGGSIIAPKYVLTAAHCVLGRIPVEIKVRAGSESIASGGTLYESKWIAIHPSFDNFTDYDIALVQVKSPITYGPKVQPIRIIAGNEEPRGGDIVIATGWGGTSYDVVQMSFLLKKLDLQCVDWTECKNIYQDKLTDRMICADAKNEAIYKGDSGGPLVNNHNKLVGISSWKRKGPSIGFPSVFTKLNHPEIAAFIHQVLQGHFTASVQI